MTLPTVTVEIGFGQTIADGHDDIVWTDVTDRVRADDGVMFNRGRAVIGSTPSAGTCTVTLANDDGALTPGRAAGEYGAITTRVPLRVTAHNGDGPFDLWWGFVTDWEWSVDGEVRASLSASDILATAARTRTVALPSGLVRNLPGDNTAARWYWPLADDVNAAQAASGIPSQADARFAYIGGGGYLDFGVESDLAGGDGTVAAFTPVSATAATYLTAGARASADGDIAVSVWLRPAVDDTLCAVGITCPAGGVMTVGVDANQRVEVYEKGRLLTYGSAAGQMPVGLWRHVYVQRDQSEATAAARVRVWVSGSELTLYANVAAYYHSPTLTASQLVTCYLGYSGGLWSKPWSGQMAHPAVFAHDRTDIAAHLADRGGGEPTAAQRFEQLPMLTGDAAGVSTWLVADSDADALMTEQAAAGATLLDLAQQVADTEAGHVVATRGGLLRLQSAASRVNADAVVALSAASTALQVDGAFSIDDAELISEVVVTRRPDGKQWRRVRTGVNVGVDSLALDVWAAQDEQGEAIADALVAADTDQPRSPTLTISMDRAAYDGVWVDELLALEIGDLIWVTDLPTSAPDTDLSLVVESISHSIGANGWTVTVDTSPGPDTVGWALGVDAFGDTMIIRL